MRMIPVVAVALSLMASPAASNEGYKFCMNRCDIAASQEIDTFGEEGFTRMNDRFPNGGLRDGGPIGFFLFCHRICREVQ